MSCRLRELIKSVRQAKTAADERTIITTECAAIRTSFKNDEADYRQRNVAKLLFIQMLGYPTHFGQIECLKLVVSPSYSDKRIGYLGLMILLDERQEVLTLVTNSLKNDMNHANQYIVGLALCALANISSASIARDLSPDVIKLLANQNPYIRKKAALCAIRIIRKAPELLENFLPKVRSLLSDRNHGVLITAITLIIEICNIEPSHVDMFKKIVPLLVRILKNLVISGYAPEHDVSGITDPFLQVKVLNLMKLLGKGDIEASDQMSDILAQVATNTEGTRNVGNSILYECVQTIMSIEAESGLRVLAVNILGRFLVNRDNNIRYVALNTLTKVVAADHQAVQRHRGTIIECLKDHDISIRKRALDLVLVLTNETNIQLIIPELINFLLSVDQDFRADITAKICNLVERFSPNKSWQFDIITKIMTIAADHIPDQVTSNLIASISQHEEIQSFATHKLYHLASHDLSQECLVQMSLWSIGEFGEMLIAPVTNIPQNQSEDEEDDSIDLSARPSESDVITFCHNILKNTVTSLSSRLFALNALIKLSDRFRSQDSVSRIMNLITQSKSSITIELQQRSCEYSTILMALSPELRSEFLKKMPPMEEKKIIVPSPQAEVRSASRASAPAPKAASAASQPKANQPTQPKKDDFFDSLFSDASSNVAKPSLNPTKPTAAVDLMELLVTKPAPITTESITSLFGQTSNPIPPTTSTGIDLLGFGAVSSPISNNNLNSNMIPVSPPAMFGQAQPPTNAPPAVTRIVAYQNNGILITMDVGKVANAPISITHIVANCANTLPFPITDFVLQLAVPKYLKIVNMASPPTKTIQPNSAIPYQIRLQNSLQGEKPLLLKIKIDFKANGQAASYQADVTNFPLL